MSAESRSSELTELPVTLTRAEQVIEEYLGTLSPAAHSSRHALRARLVELLREQGVELLQVPVFTEHPGEPPMTTVHRLKGLVGRNVLEVRRPIVAGAEARAIGIVKHTRLKLAHDWLNGLGRVTELL